MNILNDIPLRNNLKYFRLLKISHLAFLSALISSLIFMDYLFFIGLSVDIQQALSMGSVFGVLFGVILLLLIIIVLSFIGPYLLDLSAQDKSTNISHNKKKLLTLMIGNTLFWPFFWLFWILFIPNFNWFFAGWAGLGIIILLFFHLRLPKEFRYEFKWHFLIIPLGITILLGIISLSLNKCGITESWHLFSWFIFSLIWMFLIIMSFSYGKLIQFKHLFNLENKADLLSLLFLAFILLYLFPFIIHMGIVSSWTHESLSQNILFVIFVAAFLLNLAFSSIFLQNRLIYRNEEWRRSLLIPVYACLVLGGLAFTLSIKLSDNFSAMVLQKIGVVQSRQEAMWYAIVNNNKLNHLHIKMNGHDWTNGYQDLGQEYLWGYLALAIGDIRLLCPKDLPLRKNMADQCLYLSKEDLLPIGSVDNQSRKPQVKFTFTK